MRRVYYTLVLSAVLAGCSNSSITEAERKTGIRDSKTTISSSDGGDKASQSPPPKIDEYVLTPYTKASWPKTFDKYADRMPQLERFRRLAAEAAARNSECDKVIAAEISDQGTYSSMQFFVDCENMKGTSKYCQSRDNVHHSLQKCLARADLHTPGMADF